MLTRLTQTENPPWEFLCVESNKEKCHCPLRKLQKRMQVLQAAVAFFAPFFNNSYVKKGQMLPVIKPAYRIDVSTRIGENERRNRTMNMKKGILNLGFLAEILEYVESRKTLLDELTIGKRVDVLSKMETQREAEYLQQTRKEERQNIIERMGEDYAKLAGHTAEEDLREPLRKSIGKRLPWLIILLGLGLVVSSVVGAFEQVVHFLFLLFYPV